MLFVMFMGVVFLNLVMGIVIQNAFYAGQKDREATKRRQELMMQKVTEELVEIFLEVDKDGFGRGGRGL